MRAAGLEVELLAPGDEAVPAGKVAGGDPAPAPQHRPAAPRNLGRAGLQHLAADPLAPVPGQGGHAAQHPGRSPLGAAVVLAGLVQRAREERRAADDGAAAVVGGDVERVRVGVLGELGGLRRTAGAQHLLADG